MSGIIIDGVAYTPAMLRTIILERHQMAAELRLVRDTLRLRTEALNRLVEEHGPVLN